MLLAGDVANYRRLGVLPARCSATHAAQTLVMIWERRALRCRAVSLTVALTPPCLVRSPALAVNFPRGQVRQRGVLQVAVDLFDDGVPAVGAVRGDGVQPPSPSFGAVVKNAWKRHRSNKVP